MFKKILIANRGEIACRVIKTARKMGILTVAVYSEADREARHVQLADESVCIGPAPSRESYLRADRIIAACQQTGAQAVHPGYGFLSENEDFAKQVEEAGIVFIGPKHEAIAAMGDKIASKRLAQQAGVNCIPGVNEAIDTPEQAVQIARDIGYPVMIKASAGGGGKGLRVAYNDREAADGFVSCRNEARNSFGDERVFIEKFVEQPRHIEIQLLADAHGHCLYLHERECSIQRRHQKVIEEAPSPFISETTRRAMGQQAVALARAVSYQSAGTVEFVVGKDQQFYFLEMNTRLQVEHPVTECITGLDLVEWMIRIAAGEALPLTQDQVPRRGWAMECRINAEDPFRNFLPSTGRLVRFQPPPETLFAASPNETGFGVRVDTGVQEGSEISMHYDSMVAKLIVHGQDRADAMARMREALDAFVVRGISSNIPFQAALLAQPRFVAGDFHTGFIAEHYSQGFHLDAASHPEPSFLLALAAHVHSQYRLRATGISGQMQGHDARIGERFVAIPLHLGGARPPSAELQTELTLEQVQWGRSRARVQGREYQLQSAAPLGSIRLQGQVNGQPFSAQVERGVGKNPLALRVLHQGSQLDVLLLAPHVARLYEFMPDKPPPDMSRFVLSPMPGLLVQLTVQPGQKVQAGERVAVVEAMKMENVLTASADGVVSKLLARVGESLSVDQAIVEFA